MNCTVKAEIKVVSPPPPKMEVAITMTTEEAIMLRDDLRSAVKDSVVKRYGINRVLNALAELNL